MSDTLRLVMFSPGGRPVVVRDLENGSTYMKYRDSFAIAPPPRRQQMAALSRRYGGSRAVGELHDNGTIGWTALVTGGTPDVALANVEGLVADWEVALGGRYIEFRPDGGSSSVFFEIRAPAEWTWKYAQPQFSGALSSIVECKVQVAPLARLAPMDVLDDFTVDSTGDYTFDSGTVSLVAVAGGQLTTAASSLTTERRMVHTARGYLVLDSQTTIRSVPVTVTGYKAGTILRRSASDTYLDVYLDDNGTNSRLRIDVFIAGVRTNRSTVNLIARATAGASLWVRGRVEGNVVYAEHFTSAPTPLGTPTTTTSYALTSAEQAALPAGTGGLTWIPQHASATVDDFEHLPFTYRNLTLPEYVVLGGAIPGTADALADVAITTYQNYVTNPDFETNTTGWLLTGTSLSNAPTSLTRVTTAAYAGTASGQVVTPGVSQLEGPNFPVPVTFIAGQQYVARARVKAASGTPSVVLAIGYGASAGQLARSAAVALDATNWRTIEIPFTPAASSAAVIVAVTTPGGSPLAATFQIDQVEVVGPNGAPVWASVGWVERPPAFNMVWNGDFEEDADGWQVALVSGVQAVAGTSLARDTSPARTKYGTANAVIVTPASTGAGANFPLWRRFRRGVTYTATLWASAAASTTSMVLKLGVSGDVATSSATALSTGLVQWTVSWTPTADREVAYISFQTNAATATTANIDGINVFEGTTAPTVGRHAEGAGAVPPFGIIEAESADIGDLSGWAISTGDGNSRLGALLFDGTNSGAETYTAGWWIDPNLLLPDDFTLGEVDIEFWGKWRADGSNVSPRAVLSARPEWGTAFGAERFTAEYGSAGKALPRMLSGVGPKAVRLGTITLPVDPARPTRWKLFYKHTTAAGSAGTVGLDFLHALPIRKRVCGASGKANDSTYPRFVTSTAETTRIITSSLQGLVAKPPFPAQPTGGAMGGPAIEMPTGNTDLFVRLASVVPDDPTLDVTAEQLSHAATVHVAVTPRVFITKGA
jgi:hypothetical protein